MTVLAGPVFKLNLTVNGVRHKMYFETEEERTAFVEVLNENSGSLMQKMGES
jgi:hypothetical protein